MRRTSTLALLLMLSAFGTAFAQSSDDFLRSSGGELGFSFKRPSRFSGSLGLSTGRSAFATFGGTLVQDRAWFFASGIRTQTQTVTPRFDSASLTSVVGDHNSFVASSMRVPGTPQSFLSLRSTTIISPSASFTASVSSNHQ